jgi:hypothetical protein
VYSTCIYCQKPLGVNAVVEEFPVGRRLAFDSAKGRLWVVCRSCERWNLSPLDTRWEAIEACERLFEETRRRVTTDNIGLARLPEGLELVRIGQPLRPEFAAWRYGDQFGRRRRRSYLVVGGVAVAAGAVLIGASAAGIGIGGFGGLWGNIPNLINSMRVVRLRTPDGRVLKVRGNSLARARLGGDGTFGQPAFSFKHKGKLELFRGEDALAVAGRLLPAINPSGGSKRAVAHAVQSIDARRGAEAYLEDWLRSQPAVDRVKAVARQSIVSRLALEMALHEEAERRAIEGELTQLLAAWEDAERIAKISDDLLMPPEVDRRLAELKERRGSGGEPA